MWQLSRKAPYQMKIKVQIGHTWRTYIRDFKWLPGTCVLNLNLNVWKLAKPELPGRIEIQGIRETKMFSYQTMHEAVNGELHVMYKCEEWHLFVMVK